MSSRHETSLFGEALFRGHARLRQRLPHIGRSQIHHRRSLYANWGRLNVGLTRHFGVRALELYYLCTNLPNNTDVQNDLRLGFGISYHIGK